MGDFHRSRNLLALLDMLNLRSYPTLRLQCFA
jgi:hypothetical protein